MQQTYMSTHGQSAANNTVMVDGMMVNGLQSDGAVQSYFNDAMSQEVSYQTSGIGAETSAGGVRLNMIPKEGGNRFSGSFSAAYRPGEWQGDNFVDRLRDRASRTSCRRCRSHGRRTPRIGSRLQLRRKAGRSRRTSCGSSSRAASTPVNNFIAQHVHDDGGQGIDDQFIRSIMARVTWQVSPRNKFSAYNDEIDKFRGHDMRR